MTTNKITVLTADHSVNEALSSAAIGERTVDDVREWIELVVLPQRVLSPDEFAALMDSPLKGSVFTPDGIMACQTGWIAKRSEMQAVKLAQAAKTIKASTKCQLSSLDEWQRMDASATVQLDQGLVVLDNETNKPIAPLLAKQDARYSDKALLYSYLNQSCHIVTEDGSKSPVWVQYRVYLTGSKKTPGMELLPNAPKGKKDAE